MTTNVCVSLPSDLVKRIEEERKVVKMSRSVYFKRAMEAFLGLDGVDKEFVKKYAPICAQATEEDLKVVKEITPDAGKAVI